MPPSDDLPAWLRASGVPGRRRTDQRRSGLVAALAVVLFVAGGGAGYLLALRRTPAPPPTAPPPVCPPAVACVTPPAGSSGGGGASGAHAARHAKPAHAAPAALVPLPSQKPMEDGERAKALRAFAEQRAPELRDCLEAPDRGPPIELGAAFEINANGSVEVVQILGAESASADVRRCYTSHFKKWRFPTELLRGEEKLLVNFVL